MNPENYLTIVEHLITLGLGIYGFMVAFPAWKKQKQAEMSLGLKQSRFQAKIDAAKAVWALLAYMSEKENEKTVFVLRGTKELTTKNLRIKQGLEYIEALHKVFFEQGHGLFLSPKVKEDLFEFRALVRRPIEKETIHEGKKDLEQIIIKKEELWNDVTKIRERLNQALREAILESEITED
jgi:hypothetical protein